MLLAGDAQCLAHEVHGVEGVLEEGVQLAEGGLQLDDTSAPINAVHVDS